MISQRFGRPAADSFATSLTQGQEAGGAAQRAARRLPPLAKPVLRLTLLWQAQRYVVRRNLPVTDGDHDVLFAFVRVGHGRR